MNRRGSWIQKNRYISLKGERIVVVTTKGVATKGVFRGFGLEALSTTGGSYSIALVEFPDGKVKRVSLDHIKFI